MECLDQKPDVGSQGLLWWLRDPLSRQRDVPNRPRISLLFSALPFHLPLKCLAKAEEGIEDEAPNSDVNPSGRARRQKGWWKRGVVETKLNTANMTAWVHKECDIMDDDSLLRFQGSWDTLE